MGEEHDAEPPILTRIGWFFWRNGNRAVCATRGHDLSDTCICQRCGLPIPTWEEIEKLEAALRPFSALADAVDSFGGMTDAEWVRVKDRVRREASTARDVLHARH
jgi:hypothetical protein